MHAARHELTSHGFGSLSSTVEALARLTYRPKTHFFQLPVVFVDDVDQAMAEYVTLVNRFKTEDTQTA